MNEQPDQPENPGSESHTKSPMATIGESIIIVGEVSGKEDIHINGNIDGAINFRENSIVVGVKGRVNANVTAKNISVEGEVKGELRASEQVTIRPSGRVAGNIRSPRVSLDDGCQYKGSVDMEETHIPADSRSSKLRLTRNQPLPAKNIKNPGKL